MQKEPISNIRQEYGERRKNDEEEEILPGGYGVGFSA